MKINGLNVLVDENPQEVAVHAAGEFARIVRDKPNCVLGFATGNSPILTYQELIRLHKQENLSFSKVTSFNLDEYWNLDGDHDQSYRYFMEKNLFSQIDIRQFNTHVPNGKCVLPKFECSAYEDKIVSVGGIDLLLLGIGVNGHLAFNEPGSSLESRTRQVVLSETTIASNSDGRFFTNPDDVPRSAITVGIATIRDAKKIILIATGASKADAISKAIQGPMVELLPASLLQSHHDVTFILDKAAASGLKY